MAKKDTSRIQKRKHKKKKKWLFLVIPLLLIIGIVGAYIFNIINEAENVLDNSYQEDGRDEEDKRKVDPKVDDVSILFIGVDESEKRGNDSNGLSDALILATLNKDEKSVKLLSIPRDSYVHIPYNEDYRSDEYTKINHAHAYGGPTATIETVEELFDIPVDYYVKVNFEAFIDVVNTLDGITVDVPYELSEQDSKDRANAIHLMPGEQTLNGEEALALARTRKQDNDIERGKRQQDIIKAIVKKSVSVKSILKVDNLLNAVGDNMKTSMDFADVKSFVSYGTTGKLDIETLNLKGSDMRTDRYYYKLDEEDVAEKTQILKEHLNLLPDSPNEETNYNTTSNSE